MKNVAFVVLVWSLVLMTFMMGMSYATPTKEDFLTDYNWKVVKVRPGDTLYHYARSLNDNSFSLSLIVEAIRDKNDLDSSILSCGQKIEIPTKGGEINDS